MLQNFIKTNFQDLYLKEKSLKYYSFFTWSLSSVIQVVIEIFKKNI